jgi:hypothetical protein
MAAAAPQRLQRQLRRGLAPSHNITPSPSRIDTTTESGLPATSPTFATGLSLV